MWGVAPGGAQECFWRLVHQAIPWDIDAGSARNTAQTPRQVHSHPLTVRVGPHDDLLSGVGSGALVSFEAATLSGFGVFFRGSFAWGHSKILRKDPHSLSCILKASQQVEGQQ
jgi:hypothetical protein